MKPCLRYPVPHDPPRVDTCVLCQMDEPTHPNFNERYHAFWNGLQLPPKAKPKTQSGPCKHLGEPNGKVVECKPCGGNVRIKLQVCAIFGECTIERKINDMACCRGCEKYESKEQ